MRMRDFLSMSAVFLLLVSCSGKTKEVRTNVIVKTEKAVRYSGEREMEYSFISRPYRTSELSFRVGGPIDRFEVYAGNYYPQGSIIAEIDPRDFRIRKEQTEAVYKQMKAEYERIRKLYDKNNISASVYEKTRADYTSAKTAYDMAVNDLEDSRMVAPFNGYVGEVFIEKFQDVKATQPVLTLIDIDKLRVEVYVTQEVAVAVKKNDLVDIRFDMYPDKVYKAPIVEISKGTTRNNLSYLLTVLLPNPERELLSGLSGKAYIRCCRDSRSDGIAIPQEALCHRPTEGDFVWVVDESTGQVNVRKVKKGNLLPDGQVIVSEGLNENETIAVSGLRFLSDGMKVGLSSKKN